MRASFDYFVDREGLAHVVFDMPDRRVNLWSRAVLDELEQVLAELTGRGDLGAVVFRSGKDDSFVAGADLDMLAAIDSGIEATALARRGQAVFQRVADLSVPTVAAIHGACVGGGLEFALACSFRVASEDEVTRLGFPEVQLGILPAWGGTQRAPRIVGLKNALTLILTGKRISARAAERMGLVDRAVPRAQLTTVADEVARAAIRGSELPGGPGGGGLAGLLLEKNPIGRRLVLSQARKRAREETGGHYPAPFAAIDAIEVGLSQGMTQGLEAEAEAVGELAMTPAARNLIWLYRHGEAARRPLSVGTARPIRRIAILGAGVMGGAIAEVAAYRGIDVRLKDTDVERVAGGLAHAARIARRAESKGRLARREIRDLMHRISGTTKYTGFGTVDLVVEAVFEDPEVKRAVLAEAEKQVPEEAVLATNTSSLRVDDLARALSRPERFGGLHFFNPVEKMVLVEVVRGERTSADALATLHGAARALGKTPVVVGDGPGFWVNRLLMPYLNEAAHLYAEGVSIESLDATIEEFGLPMGPFALLDEIGLDVAARVGRVLSATYPERMRPHALLHRLETMGRLGRKSGRGFYRYKDGRRLEADPRLKDELGLPQPPGAEGNEAPVYEADALWARCLYPMVNEAARALADGIVASPADGDLALVLGIGWPPFRGGLLRWADEVGLPRIIDRLDEWTAAIDPRFEPSEALRERARWEGGFYGTPRDRPRSLRPAGGSRPAGGRLEDAQPTLGEGF
ncbi:MAG TPA: 3-hydroxyacyl-CoA dehydrogenase NAD-binding domain-containing protein [Gemmatimonadota bacterium]|nr:3-hydroxyacyl-CoA dehydrogenase NAD-binding domain-containing protein [Gemmatimonadota bacterium]